MMASGAGTVRISCREADALPCQKKSTAREQGSMLLMSLLIFFMVSILMMSIMQLSALEMYMSQYYYRSQQAQQLVDACLEQRCAEISQCLRSDYTITPDLPPLPLGWREDWMEMPVGDVQGRCQTSFVKLATGDGYCCYTIKFTGCFENATKTVVADLTFHYANNCDNDQAFLSRTYSDNGVITDYKIIYN